MMTKEVIKSIIKDIARENNYEINEKTIDKLINAKAMMFGLENWRNCPCDRDGKHSCLSETCKETINQTGKCCCNLFLKRED